MSGGKPSGGVPAFPAVELPDGEVPPPGESSTLRWGVLWLELDSLTGSAECWRLSYFNALVVSIQRTFDFAHLDLLYTF